MLVAIFNSLQSFNKVCQTNNITYNIIIYILAPFLNSHWFSLMAFLQNNLINLNNYTPGKLEGHPYFSCSGVSLKSFGDGGSGSGSGNSIVVSGRARFVWCKRTLEKYPISGFSCPKWANIHLSNTAWLFLQLKKIIFFKKYFTLLFVFVINTKVKQSRNTLIRTKSLINNYMI